MHIVTQDFSSIILPDEKKKYLIDNLKKWNNDIGWHKEHKFVHKKGILLYGEPGTGKSSLIKAISNMFENVFIMSLCTDDLYQEVSQLLRCRETVNGVFIVVLEDIDLLIRSRADKEATDKNKIDQNILFQIIDGIYSTENTLYIATTNHIESLDPALIRPGRFDIKLELDYFDEARAIEFVKLFGFGKDELDKMNVEYPIQPALLRAKVLEYRALTN